MIKDKQYNKRGHFILHFVKEDKFLFFLFLSSRSKAFRASDVNFVAPVTMRAASFWIFSRSSDSY